LFTVRAAARILLADPNEIDPQAIVGAVPGRKIEDTSLEIGPHATVRAFTVIYGGSRIGSHLETGHGAVIREENKIGDHLSIWNQSTIDYGCVIGNNVRIHTGVYVAQFTTIEDDVFLAPGVMIANDRHPICRDCLQGPTIKRGARVGINSTLLPAIVIGEGALVGAGSVVTKDVPPGMVVAGNPARVMGDVESLNRRVVEKYH
jgi:acetyltransferase-like isoleucine patch superfamily enzyme